MMFEFDYIFYSIRDINDNYFNWPINQLRNLRTLFGRFKCRLDCDSIYLVYEKMGLPFCRRRRRTVHNTNLLEKWLFSIIYCEKNIQSIFMKFSGFVDLV